jgi:hypothetical protein
MSGEPTLSPAASVRAIRAFLEQAVREEKAEDPPFVARVAPTSITATPEPKRRYKTVFVPCSRGVVHEACRRMG